ncbi:MAG: nucleotidyl transferase AbiEii/AbiGii toxin family protein [Lachnospiraceae bacterium]|nr:nucleotidyl transferase AbiEii/AbiGii toxin family protein [Lachnospiraceae bacterium]
MNLHKDIESFNDLAAVTAEYIGIPMLAVKRDYYIVMMLQMLAESVYADNCVFKGGTSLSKGYPGSILRFSEDIDLTFIPGDNMSKKQYDKALKNIEKIMTVDAFMEKIPEERNDRNKSSYVWFEEGGKERIKLEIGSSIRPDPYSYKEIKTYIQEYLEVQGMSDVIQEYEFTSISVNILCIERTFIDKVMSVKRHAICGTLDRKVRHIYDVTMLFGRSDIQAFLNDKIVLKELIQKTKATDNFYLEKRTMSKEYNPVESYDFPAWENCFDSIIRTRYETLHEDLLYTNEKQDFDKAIFVFRKISEMFSELGE